MVRALAIVLALLPLLLTGTTMPVAAQIAPAEPAPITLSGSGSQVTPRVWLEQGLAIIRASQSGGRGNFIGHVLGSDGVNIGLAVNMIGSGSSVRTIRVPIAGEYLMNVTSDGSWTFVIEQPRPIDAAGTPQSFSGKGDSVTGFVRLPAALVIARAAMTSGKSNFIVRVVEADGRQSDLLANTIGVSNSSKAFNGAGRLVLLSVQADGDWSISLE